ncbi:MAG: hypothetical protein GY832_37100 [Chloroflexi bacterium]|nr:hypothetical protein [Chloroflexota bacterium]
MEADLSSRRLTLAQAQVWLEHLCLKFNEIVLLRSNGSARYFAGFPIGFNVMVGGPMSYVYPRKVRQVFCCAVTS